MRNNETQWANQIRQNFLDLVLSNTTTKLFSAIENTLDYYRSIEKQKFKQNINLHNKVAWTNDISETEKQHLEPERN